MPDFEAKQWFGMFSPSETPRDIVDKINAEVQHIFADPSFRSALLDKCVGEAMVGSPEELAALIRSEREI